MSELPIISPTPHYKSSGIFWVPTCRAPHRWLNLFPDPNPFMSTPVPPFPFELPPTDKEVRPFLHKDIFHHLEPGRTPPSIDSVPNCAHSEAF